MSTQMTAEAQEASVVPLRMPRAEGLPPPAPDDARKTLFELLVRDEADLPGLIAYALHQQNKLNWHRAFEEVMGRPPTGDETQAFVLGERLPASLAIYRRLAEERITAELLARKHRVKPPQASHETSANESAVPATPTAAEVARRISWRQLGLLLLLVVGMAGAFRLLGAWLFRP